MPGILETLEGKMDTLIVALNENTKARLANQASEGGAAAGTTDAPADKPKTTRKKAEPETPTNKIDEATLVAKFDELKAIGGDIMPKLKGVIATVGGVASLAELRQLPAKFDAVYEALVALEAPAADEDDL